MQLDRPEAMAPDDMSWRSSNVGQILFRANRRFVRDKLALIQARGHPALTLSMVALIRSIDDRGSRLIDIAARSDLTKQSAHELINKGVDLGYLETIPVVDNARARLVGFTPAGRDALSWLATAVEDVEQEFEAEFGAAFLADLKAALRRYIDMMLEDHTETLIPFMASSNTAWRRDNIGRLLGEAAIIFASRVMQDLRDLGYAELNGQLSALFRNLDLEGSRLTDLAERAGVTKQSMKEAVDRAEGLGMVARRADDRDRRAKIVALTPYGMEILRAIGAHVLKAEAQMARAIDPQMIATIKNRLAHYAARTATA